MSKAKAGMRSEYKRSDFGAMQRGRFYEEAAKGTTVVLLTPQNAKAFPTSKAVNDALAGLLALNKQITRPQRGATRPRVKAVRAG